MPSATTVLTQKQEQPSSATHSHYTYHTEDCVLTQVLAPRHRYQVVRKIVAKSGAPLVEGWWKVLTQKEERLWQTWPTGKFTL